MDQRIGHGGNQKESRDQINDRTGWEWTMQVWEPMEGGIPRLIEGCREVCDLPRLVAAMREVGLSPEDIKGYKGGKLYRVLQKYI